MRLPNRAEFLTFLHASDIDTREMGVLPGTVELAIETITRVGGDTWSEMVCKLIMDEAYPNIFLFVGYALSEWQRYDRLSYSEVQERIRHQRELERIFGEEPTP